MIGIQHFFYHKQIFSFDETEQLHRLGQLVYADNGGLIRSIEHGEFDTIMLLSNGTYYKVIGTIEGWEYIIRPAITKSTLFDFEEINTYNDEQINAFSWEKKYPDDVLTIDATIKDVRIPRMIIAFPDDGYSVINKYSTQYRLSEIDSINRLGLT